MLYEDCSGRHSQLRESSERCHQLVGVDSGGSGVSPLSPQLVNGSGVEDGVEFRETSESPNTGSIGILKSLHKDPASAVFQTQKSWR